MDAQFSTTTAKGRRSYQEDRFVAEILSLDDGREMTVLAIMDGHGGAVCAEHVQELLLPALRWRLGEVLSVSDAITSVVEELAHETKSLHSGSTLSLVVVEQQRSDLFVAYAAIIGDSPVLISRRGRMPVVGPEHNVRSNREERKAAEARGGLYEHGYIWANRDCGLQMGRALGDAQMGDVVSKEAECYTVLLSEEGYVLVASDGVFDPGHEETETLIERIHGLVRDGADAESIVADAVERETGDNATAVLWRAS